MNKFILKAVSASLGLALMIADGEMVKDDKGFAFVMDDATLFTESTDLSTNYAINYFVPYDKNETNTIIAEDEDNYNWNLRYSIDSTEFGTM